MTNPQRPRSVANPKRRLPAGLTPAQAAARAKLNKKILAVIGGVLALCCCGSAVGAALGGDDQPDVGTSPSAGTNQVVAVTSTPAPSRTSARPSPTPSKTSAKPVYYADCAKVRAAGADPLFEGEPGYRKALDRNGDGLACASDDEPTKAAPPPEDDDNDVYYANCSEVRAAGAAPIRRGDPGYSRKLDRDGDGVACE